MATYVLVHGAFGCAKIWHRLAPLLEAKGHIVHAVDLPGPENDGTPISEVTLDLYRDRVAQFIQSLSRKVILVGHSMGGLVISAVAERIPEMIESLVYVTALLVKNGEAGYEALLNDPANALPPNPPGGYISMPKEAGALMFYNACSEEDVREMAPYRREIQAMAPMSVPVSLTETRFGRVPRHYVECLQDNAVPLAIQRRMQTDWPCDSVCTLDADHEPFFCKRDELAAYLDSLAV